MEPTSVVNHRVVMQEDLNHHGTLYAARTAGWFVEAGLIAAASLTSPENIVCLKIHGMTFTRPIHLGEVVHITSKIICTGRTRMVAYIEMGVKEEKIVHGFITFVNVDAAGEPLPHGIEIIPMTAEDVALQEEAKNL